MIKAADFFNQESAAFNLVNLFAVSRNHTFPHSVSGCLCHWSYAENRGRNARAVKNGKNDKKQIHADSGSGFAEKFYCVEGFHGCLLAPFLQRALNLTSGPFSGTVSRQEHWKAGENPQNRNKRSNWQEFWRRVWSFPEQSLFPPGWAINHPLICWGVFLYKFNSSCMPKINIPNGCQYWSCNIYYSSADSRKD